MLSGAKLECLTTEQGMHDVLLDTHGVVTPLIRSELAPAMTAAPMRPLMMAGTAVAVAGAAAAGERCRLPCCLPLAAPSSCASCSAGAAILPVPVCMSLHVSGNLQPLGVLKNQHSTPVLRGGANGEAVLPLALPVPLPSPLGVLLAGVPVVGTPS